jgi:Cytochrome c
MKLTQRVICSLLLFLGWIAPSALFADPGEVLFKEKHCALCHNIRNPGTVFAPACPGLQGVRHRHSKDWVRKWLKNPADVWAGNDADVQDINARYFRYRGSKPKPRESFMATIIGSKVVLTDEEIEALIDYLWKL